MQVQSIKSHIQEYFAQFSTQKITAIALNVIGAISLAAAAILAPVAMPITTVLIIGGASIFAAGFFLNFFTNAKEKNESAKGLWGNDGKKLEVALPFDDVPTELNGAEFTEDHKIKIIWNVSEERIVDFSEIPSMIKLIDTNTRFIYEKVAPSEWLKQFSNIVVVGHNVNKENAYVELSFS